MGLRLSQPLLTWSGRVFNAVLSSWLLMTSHRASSNCCREVRAVSTRTGSRTSISGSSKPIRTSFGECLVRRKHDSVGFCIVPTLYARNSIDLGGIHWWDCQLHRSYLISRFKLTVCIFGQSFRLHERHPVLACTSTWFQIGGNNKAASL